MIAYQRKKKSGTKPEETYMEKGKVVLVKAFSQLGRQ
jgi:hypothetical protein